VHVVVENTVCLNPGDAAILLSINKILNQVLGKGLKIYVFDSHPQTSSRLYQNENYADLEFRKLLSENVFKYEYKNNPLKWLAKEIFNFACLKIIENIKQSDSLLAKLVLSAEDRESLNIYANAGLVITTGGTYLVEKYDIRKRILQFRIDEALRKEVIFFTQSLGPFEDRYNIAGLKRVFAKSPLILLRDEKSLAHIFDIVADRSKCHVVADSVFALADTDRISGILNSAERPDRFGRVAISVRNWAYVKDGRHGMQRYVDAVRQIVASLVRRGKKITFVSTCQGVPEYAHDDSATARAIVSGLDPSLAGSVAVDAAFRTPEELMELLKGFDFAVATRMHMMIMSLCVGTPVLPIANEFKTQELARRLGLSDVLLDIDTISGVDAVAKMEAFADNLAEFRKRSLEAALRENASAMSTIGLLENAVRGKLSGGADSLPEKICGTSPRSGEGEHQQAGQGVA
jgi:colanic acid/amylovoran biosynthesis protein